MALYFQNLYSDTVFIAFLWNDGGCSGTPWRNQAWWAVASGQTFNAWDTDLRNVNRYAAFYGEEFGGSTGATWSGSGNNWYWISDAAFSQCYDDTSNLTRQEDYINLDFNGYSDVTVVLGPQASQVAVQGSVPPHSDHGDGWGGFGDGGFDDTGFDDSFDDSFDDGGDGGDG